MDEKKISSTSFNPQESLQVIREMIQVSRKKIKSDGILFMVWGYAMSIMYASNYAQHTMFLSVQVKKAIVFVASVLPMIALGFTIIYFLRKKTKVTTYVGISLRYIWVSLFVSLMLINVIMFNVLQEVNFTLQHPLFMVIIAFAVLVTGIILRYRIIIIGAIIYGGLALVCSYLALRDQMLFDAIAWFIAFVIPGHVLYFKRNR